MLFRSISTAGVAQLVEHQIVAMRVVGSNPIARPKKKKPEQ